MNARILRSLALYTALSVLCFALLSIALCAIFGWSPQRLLMLVGTTVAEVLALHCVILGFLQKQGTGQPASPRMATVWVGLVAGILLLVVSPFIPFHAYFLGITLTAATITIILSHVDYQTYSKQSNRGSVSDAQTDALRGTLVAMNLVVLAPGIVDIHFTIYHVSPLLYGTTICVYDAMLVLFIALGAHKMRRSKTL